MIEPNGKKRVRSRRQKEVPNLRRRKVRQERSYKEVCMVRIIEHNTIYEPTVWVACCTRLGTPRRR